MDGSLSRRPVAAVGVIDRRRSLRVEILGTVQGHLVSLDVPISVRDMSLGGMAVETSFPFEVESLHGFQLELGDGSWVTLRAQVRHCRNLAAPGDQPLYVTGFEFVDERPHESATTIGDLLDKITGERDEP